MTNDKQRDRLVELLAESSEKVGDYIDSRHIVPTAEEVHSLRADYLLANGVIVPPCKVGDKVYEVLLKCDYIRSLNVVGFHLGKFPDLRGHKRKEYLVCYSDYSLTRVDIDKFGKTVFLTKEEAEAKLKEGVQG